ERRSANPATLYRALLERARALRDGSARSALAAEIAHRDLVAGKVDPWLNALRELEAQSAPEVLSLLERCGGFLPIDEKPWDAVESTANARGEPQLAVRAYESALARTAKVDA